LMTKLVRLKAGENLEEDHMRNRQLVAGWVYEKGMAEKVIEKVKKDGKTFFIVRDYQKLRKLFGELLQKMQKITSEGDYNGAKELVETYGVKVDHELHKEVLERYKKLKVAPYQGFIQPKLVPKMDANGKITNIEVEYPTDFAKQMLEYGKTYSVLPNVSK